MSSKQKIPGSTPGMVKSCFFFLFFFLFLPPFPTPRPRARFLFGFHPAGAPEAGRAARPSRLASPAADDLNSCVYYMRECATAASPACAPRLHWSRMAASSNHCRRSPPRVSGSARESWSKR